MAIIIEPRGLLLNIRKDAVPHPRSSKPLGFLLSGCTLLVGHNRSSKAKTPRLWERWGSSGKGGEGSARTSNGYRVIAAPKGINVKV